MKRIARRLILKFLPNQFESIQLIYQKIKFLNMVGRIKLRPEPLSPRLAIWPKRKIDNDTSQFGQSSLVHILLEDLVGGIFVDIGSNDPQYNSNSYYLETEKKWTGYAFEPLDLYNERYASSRQSTVLHNCAIGAEVEDKWLEVRHSEEGWEDQLSTVRDNDSSVSDSSVNSVKIKVLPLSSFGLPSRIDFLSIDVEGSEMKVLEGIDWAKFSAQIVCIENCTVLRGDTNIREKLVEHGYVFFARISYIDDVFVSQELLSNIDKKLLTEKLKPFFSVYRVA